MKDRLDSFVHTITMYRLMLYSLLAMAVYALSLAFVGVLDFNPLTMVLALFVLVTVGYGVNYAFAYLFRVRTNFESTFITSLILFFIFSPAEGQSFVTLAIVAALASASKYLLAWRRRHIFNPAAIAAVVSGLIGLQYASWWVATAVMLPVVLAFGGLVLYKTRRLKMGGLYLGASLVVLYVGQIIHGTFGNISVVTYLTSWPLVFFAAFMLSEPLTLPPRRYQRYVLAVIVAILANGGFVLGPVSSTPEIALVIGNIVAFMWGQRKAVLLRFMSRKPLPGGQVEYTFTPLSPLHFFAGQYMELQLPHAHQDARGERRMFTISSAPGNETITLTTRHYHPSSSFKKALLHLSPGTIVKATGIYGDFILPKKPDQKLLLIAGGIGVTPFKSQLEHVLQAKQRRDAILLYFVRSEEDVIYTDILSDQRHGVTTHIITTEIDEDTLKKYVPDIAERAVYVSGPPTMVGRTKQLVAARHPKAIVTDFFSGY